MIGSLLWCAGLGSASVPDSPIIGIVAQPTGASQQYIAASYVKFVESAGARAVPLSYYATNETSAWWFDRLNGVLFPGGGSDLPDVARFAVQYAIDAFSANGEIFPVWGTCLGFEWLGEALGGTLSDFDANNVSLTLNLLEPAASTSYLLGGDDKKELRDHVSNEAITMNNHNYGLAPSEFADGTPLGSFFDVLSTSTDLSGQTFVSTIEAKENRPLYGVQWHPEKNIWETGQNEDGSPYEAINHSASAVDATLTFAASLARAARQSTHFFDNAQDEATALFANCEPSTALAPAFVQTYFFDANWTGAVDGPAACPPPPSQGGKLPSSEAETTLLAALLSSSEDRRPWALPARGPRAVPRD